MKNLLTLNYWFNLRPESLLPYAQKTLIGFIILLALLALALAIINIKSRGSIYRGLFKRLYSFCLGNTLIGLVISFFNYEDVPFLSARFWLGLWILIMIIWLVFITKKLKAIPQQKKQVEQEKELKKYLP